MQYIELAKTYDLLEKTTKRLEKTKIVSDLFRRITNEDCEHIILLLQGRLFHKWDSRETGVAQKLLIKSIELATGKSESELESVLKDVGDLGLTAEKLIEKKTQLALFSNPITTQKVFDNLQKVATIEGQGTVDKKIQLIAELLTSSEPIEARYLVRTILGQLRIGLGEGTLRNAILWSCFGKELYLKYNLEKNEIDFPENNRTKYDSYSEQLQEAIDIANDFSVVLKKARNGFEQIREVQLIVGRPVNVMLFQKAKNIAEALETVGKPAAVEKKYDGFRVQIHKDKDKINLFTRRLENINSQFPDIMDVIASNISADTCIIDAEIVGYDKTTKKLLPFQNISQRIKRKYDIHEMSKQFPVEIKAFDCLYFNGKMLLKEPFQKRRRILESCVNKKEFRISLAEEIITEDIEQINSFYEQSLSEGQEGLMIKNLAGVYKPGSRVGYGVKVKPTMETIEAVITGAEWGSGKRSAWLSSFVIAIKNGDEFTDVGKVGTGFKEKSEEGVSFDQITELLKPLILKEDCKEVKVNPEIVIEVAYEEIQKSPTYNSGYALRFPRFVRLRNDKGVEDISSLNDIEAYYRKQRGRSK